MKESLMSSSGILWVYFELIYERNPRVFSKSGSGVHWWVFCDQTLNLPTGYIEGILLKNSPINSQFTPWVTPPLLPVLMVLGIVREEEGIV